MHQQIASFPSDTLYDSNLISSPAVAKRTLLSLPTIDNPDSEDAKDALEHPVIFFDTAGCEFYEKSEGDRENTSLKGVGEGSKCNENEAEVVAKWARKLVTTLLTLCSLRSKLMPV
jgi:DNA polymerase alpha-associated DNA helicase A